MVECQSSAGVLSFRIACVIYKSCQLIIGLVFV